MLGLSWSKAIWHACICFYQGKEKQSMRSGLTLKHKYLFGDSKGLPIVFGKRELKFDHTHTQCHLNSGNHLSLLLQGQSCNWYSGTTNILSLKRTHYLHIPILPCCFLQDIAGFQSQLLPKFR